MAIFHCDHCGHQKSVPQECLNRNARCPECLQLSVVRDPRNIGSKQAVPKRASASNSAGLKPPRSEDSPKTAASRRGFPVWPLAALCGVIALFQGWAVWNAYQPEDRSEVSQAIQHDSSRLNLSSIADTQGPSLAHATSIAEVRRGKSETPPVKTSSVVVEDAVLPKGNLEVSTSSTPAVPLAAIEPSAEQPVVNAILAPSPVVASAESGPIVPPVKPAPSKAFSRQLAEGKMLFEHQWQQHDALAGKGDGLGPVFNGHSCVECHFQGGTGGSGTNSHNVQAFEVWPGRDGEDVREGVIHAFAVHDRLKETKAQAITELGAGKIPFRQKDTDKLLMLDAARTVFINTPALWGNGVIDEISDQDLVGLEQAYRLTGRLRRLPNGQIGKFGWKSQIASLHEFIGSACAAELGLTNSVRSQQEPQSYQDDKQAKRDMTDTQVASLVSYVADLPAPQQIIPKDPLQRNAVKQGYKLFSQIGCAQCHVEDVGAAQGVYSDFRLHLVAASASSQEYYPRDAKPVYQPQQSYPQLGEWKTPPLWGVADTAPYWHDGSATTLQQAILKHDEEARDVKIKFERLEPKEQHYVLDFLESLKAPQPTL